MDNFDVIIIGAGIIGLATAYKILESDSTMKVCILEKEETFAKHQSGHNSNVIHSGIYYKPGSLKALNCIAGYNMMLDFCNEHEIRYDLCGKFIVSVNKDEENILNGLYDRGLENGLSKIELISGEELTKRESNIIGTKAIFIPYTGITDYRVISEAIYGDVMAKGGKIFFNSEVKGISQNGGCVVNTKSGNYSSKFVVNCAGLYSDIIAMNFIKDINIRILPFRGEYYLVRNIQNLNINSLIYPVPDPSFPFLGIHLTKTLGGNIEAGPNAVPAFRREGYKKSDINFSELWNFVTYKGSRKLFRKYWRTGLAELKRSYSKSAFANEVSRYMPGIKYGDLSYAGSGVRAQACDIEGNTKDDFVIYETENSINVCNAPSPAATSSLSIGKTISDKLMSKINH